MVEGIPNLFPDEDALTEMVGRGTTFNQLSDIDKQIFTYQTKLNVLKEMVGGTDDPDIYQLLLDEIDAYPSINKVSSKADMAILLENLYDNQKEAELLPPTAGMDEFPLDLSEIESLDGDLDDLAQWMLDHRPKDSGYTDYEEIQSTFDQFFDQLSMTDAEAIDAAKKDLEIGFADGDEATSVTQDLTLPTTGDHGVTISWNSSDANVIDSGGNVTRPSYAEGNKTVTLTATITKGDASETKTFTVTVKAAPAQNGGSSGGGGSSGTPGPAPSPDTEEILIDVTTGGDEVIAKTPITRITHPGGNVEDTVTFTSERAKEATEQLRNKDEKTARIVIPDPKDIVTQTNIEVPKDAVTTLAKDHAELEIATEYMRVFIPNESLDGFTDDLYFRFIPVKKEAEQKQIEDRAKEERVVHDIAGSMNVVLLGRPMTIETNMQSRPVTLSIPLKGVLPVERTAMETVLQNLVVFIEHSDGDKEIKRGTILYDKDGNPESITFDVNKFSTFTLLTIEGLATPVVERLYGEDRYETSRALSEHLPDHSLDTVILASGRDFPDALAGGTLVKALNGTR